MDLYRNVNSANGTKTADNIWEDGNFYAANSGNDPEVEYSFLYNGSAITCRVKAI